MSRRRWASLKLGLALAAAMVIIQVVLPWAAQERLHKALTELIPQHDALTVQLNTFPALRLAMGTVDVVSIDVMGPKVGGVHFAWLALRGKGVQIDIGELLDRRLQVRQAESLLIEAALGDEELTRYVQSQLPQVSEVTVDLSGDTVLVRGVATVLGRSVRTTARGTLEPAGISGIRFVPHDIAIEGIGLPDVFVQAVGALLEWHLDLSFMPFEVHIQSIEVAGGHVVAKGAWIAGE